MTPEQQARDLLERMGVEDAQSFSSGDLVELANIISDADHYRKEYNTLLSTKVSYEGILVGIRNILNHKLPQK